MVGVVCALPSAPGNGSRAHHMTPAGRSLSLLLVWTAKPQAPGSGHCADTSMAAARLSSGSHSSAGVGFREALSGCLAPQKESLIPALPFRPHPATWHHSTLQTSPSDLASLYIAGVDCIFILFERERDRQTDGERSSIHWLIPLMPTTARAGPGQSQKPGTPSGSPMWVTGTQVLESSPACSHGAH